MLLSDHLLLSLSVVVFNCFKYYLAENEGLPIKDWKFEAPTLKYEEKKINTYSANLGQQSNSFFYKATSIDYFVCLYYRRVRTTAAFIRRYNI